jgi:hypothetical protein
MKVIDIESESEIKFASGIEMKWKQLQGMLHRRALILSEHPQFGEECQEVMLLV